MANELREGCGSLLRSQSAESEGRATRPQIGQLGQKRGGSKRVSPPRKSGDRDSVQIGREGDVCLSVCLIISYSSDGAR